MVHSAKPSVCALYPLGRFMKIDSETFNQGSIEGATVQYLLQDDVNCGDKSETHTVRDWLAGFDILKEDTAFIAWNVTLAKVLPRVKELEPKLSPLSQMLLWDSLLVGLYLNYETDKDYLPQLEANTVNLCGLLDKLEAAIKEAGRGKEG